MTKEYYNHAWLSKFYGLPLSKTTLFKAEERGLVARAKRYRSGAIFFRGWTIDQLPQIGGLLGILKKPSKPMVVSVFTTKGGVLKTTLSLNLARFTALHNIKTCVVGLDMQGDITRAMGHNLELEEEEDLSLVLEKLNETRGLADIFNKSCHLEDTVLPTDIPTLSYIPETPELVAFNESLSTINRREYWLKEKVIEELKQSFDLIIMDCSPNWNRLITNALVCSDLLLSPLECKINNFRNFKVFRYFLQEFRNEMNLPLHCLFVPTRYSAQKKLSMDIRDWYHNHVDGRSSHGIRESVAGEEASALRLSIPEYCSGKGPSQEMRELLLEIHQHLGCLKEESLIREKIDRPLQKEMLQNGINYGA